MAIDRREDAGEFYPGGKTISTQPVKGGGDVKHEDFADVANLPDRFNDTMIHDKLNEVIGLLKGPVAAFALTLALDVLLGAFSVQGAGVIVQTTPKGAVFNDEQIVTNVVFDATGLATPEMVTNIVQDVSPVPDFSPSNATLVETIEATSPAPGDYASVSNRAMNALPATARKIGTHTHYTVESPINISSGLTFASSGYLSVSEIYHPADGILTVPYGKTGDIATTSDIADAAISLTNYTDAATNALAIVATSGSYDDLANKPTIPANAADVGAYSAANGATLAAQVGTIGAHLNAEDARFVSTNYNSQVHLPEASVEVSVSNEWLTVWREMTRWDAFVGSGFDWTSWGGFLSWMSTTEAALDQKADRAWGYYDSHTGGWAPEGYTQVSSSNILIAAGMGYQRTVSSGHTYWVLTANEPYEVSGISSNGFFRVADADGNVQFEIIKGDKRTVPAPPDGVSASGGVLTVSYPVASQPTVEVSLTLADGGTWYAEDSASCPATVAWSGTSGAYVATVTPSAPTAQLFVKASYQVGGETFINNRAPISITGGIYFNGTLYMPTVSGNELKFIAQ